MPAPTLFLPVQGDYETRRRVALELLRLVQESYRDKSAGGRGADGERWPEWSEGTVRAKRGRRGPLNYETGRLFASIACYPIADGVELTATAPYAEFVHAQRPLWPEREAWPQSWTEALLRAAYGEQDAHASYWEAFDPAFQEDGR